MTIPIPLFIALIALVVLFFAMAMSSQRFLRKAWSREDEWIKIATHHREASEYHIRINSSLEREVAAYKEMVALLKAR